MNENNMGVGGAENKLHVRVKVSAAAYERIKELSKKPIYKGRGIVGVIDQQFLGEFTTTGSGGTGKGGRLKAKTVEEPVAINTEKNE